MSAFYKTNSVYYFFYGVIFILSLAFTRNINQFEPLLYLDHHRDNILNFYFRWMTQFGEIYPYLFFSALFLFQKQKMNAYKIGLAGLITLILSLFLKDIFLHPRPSEVLSTANQIGLLHWVPDYPILKGRNSFPSGHATSAFALWTIVAFTRPTNFTFGICCLFIAVSVGVSRMYLCAHFPQDVIAGSFCGVWVATLVELIFEKRKI